MDGNKNYSLKKKIVYELDNFISKGFWAQLALLIGCVMVLSFICACGIMIFADGKDFGDTLWESLMHIIDQGTITGDDTDNTNYLLIMLIITFIGMAFTSVIIGITSSAITIKMDDLNKGHSRVVKKDHVVVLGFNERAHTIKNEIEKIRYKNGESCCLVIADDLPKADMEQETKEVSWSSRDINEDEEEAKKRTKNTDTIFKSGDPASENTFDMCSVKWAREIIVNGDDDYQTVRILLALTAYLKKSGAYIGDERMPAVVALIRRRENLSAARIAADVNKEEGTEGAHRRNADKVRILYLQDIFASLFAQACVEPSQMLTLKEVISSDSSIHDMKDTAGRINPTAGGQEKDKNKKCLLIIGGSAVLPVLLRNMNGYCGDGSDINIISQQDMNYDSGSLNAFDSRYLIEDDPYNWNHVQKQLEEHPYWFDENDERHLTNVIILSDDTADKTDADEKTIVILLNIREYIKEKCDFDISIITEIKLSQNQALVQTADDKDFVIGYQAATKIMVRVAENPEICDSFETLLVKHGSHVTAENIEQAF